MAQAVEGGDEGGRGAACEPLKLLSDTWQTLDGKEGKPDDPASLHHQKYAYGDTWMDVLTPSKSFDPVAASDAMLEKLQFSPRPDDPKEYDAWVAEVRHAKAVETVPCQVADAQPLTYWNTRWAGQVSDQGSSDVVRSIHGKWKSPAFVFHCNSSSDDATWVGIGGYHTNDLFQAGFSANTGNYGGSGSVDQVIGWAELLPWGPTFFPGVDGWGGDTMDSSIGWSGGTGYVHVGDDTNGYYTNATVGISAADLDGRSGEWIDEAVDGYKYRKSGGTAWTEMSINGHIPTTSTMVDMGVKHGSTTVATSTYNSSNVTQADKWHNCG